jgi:lipopolysaccharide assembly protein A
MNIVIWIVRIVVVVLLVLFAAKNADIVTLNGIGGALKAPLALILLGFFGAGLVLGLASSLMSIFKLKREVRKLNRALQQRVRADAELPPPSPQLPQSQVPTAGGSD